MISTGQVTNKKSAMDEPHYWLARGKLRGMCREPAIYIENIEDIENVDMSHYLT